MSGRRSAWILATAAFGLVAWAVLSLPTPAPGLTDRAFAALDDSGVTNPVTAVLLNYRSTDTLLELGVLLLAVVSVWGLRPSTGASFGRPPGPLLEGLLRILVPLLVLFGGYLLWIGAFAPGGAFQGGALVGGAIVLAVLGGLSPSRFGDRPALLRAGLAAGLAVFSCIGLSVMIAGGWFLDYPGRSAKVLILIIEAAATVSIGLTLGCLFIGGRPTTDGGPEPES
ncbi:MAG: MnhB domain-containing protein [Thermoanaerobaculales bacterium]|nr:MnhB domain-containing protein [Thermoanaerobaculales bacterium]